MAKEKKAEPRALTKVNLGTLKKKEVQSRDAWEKDFEKNVL